MTPFYRTISRCILCVFACLTMAGCRTYSAPEMLHAGEVLRRSVLRVMTEDNLSITATGSSVIWKNERAQEVLFSITGGMLPLRHEWSMNVSLEVSGSGHLKKRSMSFFSSDAALKYAPDPHLLSRTVDALSIDEAILRQESRRDFVYILTVHVLPSLLSEARSEIRGTLRIDAQSFLLREADWKMTNIVRDADASEVTVHYSFTSGKANFFANTGSAVFPDAIFDMISGE